ATDAAGAGSARSFYGAEDLGFETPLDLQATLAVKQFFPMGPAWSLSWGLSAASGPNPTGIGNRTDVYGTDVYLRYRPVHAGAFTVVTLESEWFLRRRQVPGDLWSDLNGYTQATWRFQPRWVAAARWEYGAPSRGLDGAVVDDTLDPDWTADRHRLTGALTFLPTEFSRLRLQGAADLVGWRDAPDYAAMLAFEFNVGAHGAHTF
ncbi:MAG: zinc-regulated TonB-dependent outer membrane receptor, partial [Myxococcota bacterium]